MPGTVSYISNRIVGFEDVNGVGSFEVAVNFVPNFQVVEFYDIAKTNPSPPDSYSWDYTATATGYTFTVNYNTAGVRTLKYVVAILAVDPEQTQTISF